MLPYICLPLTYKHFPGYRAEGNSPLNPFHFEIEEINQIMNKSHNSKHTNRVGVLLYATKKAFPLDKSPDRNVNSNK